MATKKRSAKPVKRKPVKRRKKKQRQFTLVPVLSSLRSIIIWAIVVLLAILAVLYLSECSPGKIAGSSSGLKSPQSESAPSVNHAVPVSPVESGGNPLSTRQSEGALTVAFPTNVELPQVIVDRKEEIISYEGYTVSYNVDYKLANWVAWELTAEEALSKKEERAKKFSVDPTLKGKTALNEDYSKTGFDRGHLAPAGDMKWSNKAMQESFYYSNIVPQNPKLNRGLWNALEIQSRNWAAAYGKVLISSGPVLKKDMRRLGKNRVAVPEQLYKVVCTITDNRYQGVGFLLDNKDYRNTSLKDLAIPIDSVEKVTGIKFFSLLPEDACEQMKAGVNLDFWFQ